MPFPLTSIFLNKTYGIIVFFALLTLKKIRRIFERLLKWLRIMDEEKQNTDEQGGQVLAKDIGELMTPVENIPDEVIASKEGGIFLKALYQQADRKSIKLQKQLDIVSKQKIDLEKENIVLGKELETKSFTDFISSILVGIAVVLIELGIRDHNNFLWIMGTILVVVSIIMMFRLTKFKNFILRKEIK
jgi:hypothetical protein